MDLNQIIIVILSTLVFAIALVVAIKSQNKIFNALDKHNETVINQYKELMAYEKENNLRHSSPPTVSIIKSGYTLFLPSEEQINHFKQN